MGNLLLTFKGRLRRLAYFKGMLVIAGVLVVAWAMDVAVAIANPVVPPGGFTILAVIACLWPLFALSIKRLHDLDLSGWLSLLNLVPYLGLLFNLYLLFAPGSERANRFGARDASRSAAMPSSDRRATADGRR